MHYSQRFFYTDMYILITFVPHRETITYVYNKQCDQDKKKEGLICNISEREKEQVGDVLYVTGVIECIPLFTLPLWACDIYLLCSLHRNWPEQTCLASKHDKQQLAWALYKLTPHISHHVTLMTLSEPKGDNCPMYILAIRIDIFAYLPLQTMQCSFVNFQNLQYSQVSYCYRLKCNILCIKRFVRMKSQVHQGQSQFANDL